jgi:adenine-specific DNA-methyltransferase
MARPGTKADRLAKDFAAGQVLFGAEPTRLASSGSSAEASVLTAPSPEELFLENIPASHRRQYGQFFTPRPIAELMCEWLAIRQPATLLDPAVGPGIFVRTLRERGVNGHLTAIDKDPLAVTAFRQSMARQKWLDNLQIHQVDFLRWDSSEKFDAIIANPPYVRHHDLHYGEDIFAKIGQRSGVALSRLTNIYGLFILEICRRLKPGGRAAILVPGEWLNANFGVPLKRHLLQHHLLKHLVYFSHAESVFPDVLTTASLLFVEKSAGGEKVPGKLSGTTPMVLDSERETDGAVKTIFVHSAQSLAPLRETLFAAQPSSLSSSPSPSLTIRTLPHAILLEQGKWNALLEHGPTTLPVGFVYLEELATTRRGIATGANQFFHVSREALRSAELSDDIGRPCVGRAADVEGYRFTLADLEKLEARGKRTRLLHFHDPLTTAARRYVEEGVRLGLPKRYLLASRKPWYAMEARPPSPIWAAVFGRKELRFVWNEAGVQNLTTFHCVYPHALTSLQSQALVACLNCTWMQQLAAEQQRVYGGGLLKYEPRDLLRIPVPDLRHSSNETLNSLVELSDSLSAARGNPPLCHTVQQQLRTAVDQAAREAAANLASS